MSEDKSSDFVNKEIEKHGILVDWFADKINTDEDFSLVNADAKLVFFLMEDGFAKQISLLEIDGKIVSFLTSEDTAEIGFQPNDPINLAYKDFNFDAKIYSDDSVPRVWTMFKVEIDNQWKDLVPHKFSEVIDFTKDHTINIEKIDPKYFHDGADLEMFDGVGKK